jgi:hypothetical protein
MCNLVLHRPCKPKRIFHRHPRRALPPKKQERSVREGVKKWEYSTKEERQTTLEPKQWERSTRERVKKWEYSTEEECQTTRLSILSCPSSERGNGFRAAYLTKSRKLWMNHLLFDRRLEHVPQGKPSGGIIMRHARQVSVCQCSCAKGLDRGKSSQTSCYRTCSAESRLMFWGARSPETGPGQRYQSGINTSWNTTGRSIGELFLQFMLSRR